MKNRILIVIALISVSAALSLYYQDRLPCRVPVHFNGQGLPDRYGSKTPALVMFPVMQAFVCFIYLISFKLVQDPKYWRKKLRKPVSDQALSRLISKSNLVVDCTMIGALILFLFLQIQTLRIALGKIQGLGPGLFILLGLGFCGIILLVIRINLAQRRELKEADGNPPLQGS